MDLEVVEIAPPPVSSRSSKRLKRKEVILHENSEIIDVDEYENSADTMVGDMKIDSRKKGKGIKSISNGYLSHQAEDSYSNNFVGPGGVETFTVNGIESTKCFAPLSNHSINLSSHSSDSYYDANKYIYTNDVINVDDYEVLQSQFENVDIPSVVEAPLPWFPGLAQLESKTIAHNRKMLSEPGLTHQEMDPKLLSDLGLTHYNMDPNPSLWSSGSAQLNMKAASVAEMASSQLFKQVGHNMPFAEESSQSSQFLKPSFLQNSSSSSLNHEHAMKIPHIAQIPPWGHGSNLPYSVTPSQMGPLNHHHHVGDDAISWFQAFHKHKKPSLYDAFNGISHEEAYNGWDQEYAGNQCQKSRAGGSIAYLDPNSNSGKDMNLEDVTVKLRSFKQFDTVDDHSDHHYAQKGYSMKQPSKVWAKRIQEEWKILEKDLPDTIFVRVYESRMDILRAVIKGAEGTPYHDGLFFFDVFFPSDYPNIPPHVHYHAGGLRLNPNLYACGKVCLSLLNTWSGNKNEKWIPGTSSMLQVLVSIQGLILNSKPYFNEPGYANMSGTLQGESYSLKYNEDTFLLSLRTMSFTMKRPPKHFEDLVVGHFCERAHDILVACKAYIDGAQVGCLVKGGVQDVDEGDKTCSDAFKKNVAQYLDVLVLGFKNIGAKNFEKLLPPSKTRRT